MTAPLLEVRGLSVRYLTERGRVPACDQIDLDVRRGQILGIAGESASGKSTLLTAVTRLQRVPAVTSAGSILYHPPGGRDPVDLARLNDQQLSPLRWSDISIVMQSAMACLNPVMKVGKQFTDVLQRKNKSMTTSQALDQAERLLRMVGVPGDSVMDYPHQLSGGMRQRALIALALACDPELVVMDEPTTAVDVVLQRRILTQVMALQAELGFAVMFVTHDLSLLLEISDHIAIMYGGRIVEVGTSEQIYRAARHPYTRGLRNSFPPLSEPVRRITGIPGAPPDLLHLPTGCAFEPRCSQRTDVCTTIRPELTPIGKGQVACHHPLADGEGRPLARSTEEEPA